MGFRPTKALSPAARVLAGQRTAAQRAGLFVALCQTHKLPAPVCELKFHPTRRWRFDFAWPEAKLALESEGGSWTGGRHTRGHGFRNDCAKYSEASLLGWRVLRVLSSELCTTETLALVRRGLAIKDAA